MVQDSALSQASPYHAHVQRVSVFTGEGGAAPPRCRCIFLVLLCACVPLLLAQSLGGTRFEKKIATKDAAGMERPCSLRREFGSTHAVQGHPARPRCSRHRRQPAPGSSQQQSPQAFSDRSRNAARGEVLLLLTRCHLSRHFRPPFQAFRGGKGEVPEGLTG